MSQKVPKTIAAFFSGGVFSTEDVGELFIYEVDFFQTDNISRLMVTYVGTNLELCSHNLKKTICFLRIHFMQFLASSIEVVRGKTWFVIDSIFNCILEQRHLTNTFFETFDLSPTIPTISMLLMLLVFGVSQIREVPIYSGFPRNHLFSLFGVSLVTQGSRFRLCIVLISRLRKTV